MVLYSENPKLKFKKVQTSSGHTEYLKNCKKIEEKYKERLKQLKVDHKAIASVDFKMPRDGDKMKETQLSIV